MNSLLKYLILIAFYGALAILLGYFSQRPSYQHLPPGQAVVIVSLTHPGERVEECRKPTKEELEKHQPNMRPKEICPRARVPIVLELLVNNKQRLSIVAKPAGLSRDGASQIYEKFSIPEGAHEFEIRMRDTRRMQGYDWIEKRRITLSEGQNLVIDFRSGFGFMFEHSHQ